MSQLQIRVTDVKKIFRGVYLLGLRGVKAVSPISINLNINQEISDVFFFFCYIQIQKATNIRMHFPGGRCVDRKPEKEVLLSIQGQINTNVKQL